MIFHLIALGILAFIVIPASCVGLYALITTRWPHSKKRC